MAVLSKSLLTMVGIAQGLQLSASSTKKSGALSFNAKKMRGGRSKMSAKELGRKQWMTSKTREGPPSYGEIEHMRELIAGSSDVWSPEAASDQCAMYWTACAGLDGEVPRLHAPKDRALECPNLKKLIEENLFNPDWISHEGMVMGEYIQGCTMVLSVTEEMLDHAHEHHVESPQPGAEDMCYADWQACYMMEGPELHKKVLEEHMEAHVTHETATTRCPRIVDLIHQGVLTKETIPQPNLWQHQYMEGCVNMMEMMMSEAHHHETHHEQHNHPDNQGGPPMDNHHGHDCPIPGPEDACGAAFDQCYWSLHELPNPDAGALVRPQPLALPVPGDKPECHGVQNVMEMLLHASDSSDKPGNAHDAGVAAGLPNNATAGFLQKSVSRTPTSIDRAHFVHNVCLPFAMQMHSDFEEQNHHDQYVHEHDTCTVCMDGCFALTHACHDQVEQTAECSECSSCHYDAVSMSSCDNMLTSGSHDCHQMCDAKPACEQCHNGHAQCVPASGFERCEMTCHSNGSCPHQPPHLTLPAEMSACDACWEQAADKGAAEHHRCEDICSAATHDAATHYVEAHGTENALPYNAAEVTPTAFPEPPTKEEEVAGSAADVEAALDHADVNRPSAPPVAAPESPAGKPSGEAHSPAGKPE